MLSCETTSEEQKNTDPLIPGHTHTDQTDRKTDRSTDGQTDCRTDRKKEADGTERRLKDNKQTVAICR